MVWIYVSAALLGLGLIGMSSFGHDVDDITADFDASHDIGLLALFSLRNLAWASLAFGGIGTLGVLTGRGPVFTLIAASVVGVGTLLGVHVLFRLLQRTEAGDLPNDAHVMGLPARLVLPFNEEGHGVVSFHANGQSHELPARRASDVADADSTMFDECEIDTIERGVAIVRPVGR